MLLCSCTSGVTICRSSTCPLQARLPLHCRAYVHAWVAKAASTRMLPLHVLCVQVVLYPDRDHADIRRVTVSAGMGIEYGG
jgi:hypothetical protein